MESNNVSFAALFHFAGTNFISLWLERQGKKQEFKSWRSQQKRCSQEVSQKRPHRLKYAGGH
jgi:hypothetical protein